MNTIHFDEVKKRLAELTFARVARTVAKDLDLISFQSKDGLTVWDDDPEFSRERRRFSGAEWDRSLGRSYMFHYGFAESGSKSIHFDSKGQVDVRNLSLLGVDTRQDRLCPVSEGSWVVGVEVESQKGPHFYRWVQCTKEEKIFADFVRQGKSSFQSHELSWLFISRSAELGYAGNRLCTMAMLFLARDLEYFLEQRLRAQDGKCVDSQVFCLCSQYDAMETWNEYMEKAQEQRIYSSLIKEPSPKQIKEPSPKQIKDCREPVDKPVGLCTPFAHLSLL